MGFISNNVAKNTVENFLNTNKNIVLENKEISNDFLFFKTYLQIIFKNV